MIHNFSELQYFLYYRYSKIRSLLKVLLIHYHSNFLKKYTNILYHTLQFLKCLHDFDEIVFVFKIKVKQEMDMVKKEMDIDMPEITVTQIPVQVNRTQLTKRIL